MTGPLVFDPTPYPILDDECDGVAAFSGVSTVSGANFDKLRGFLAAPPARYLAYQSRQVAGFDPLPAGLRVWSNLTPAQFPGLSVPVPAACPAVLVNFTAQVTAKGSQGTWTEMGVTFSGTGLSAIPAIRCAVYARNNLQRVTRSHLFLSAELVPGGQIVVTPALAFDSTGASCQAVLGVLDVLVFTGA